MLKKSKSLFVQKEAPFAADKLGYCQQFGEYLGNVIGNSHGACTIAIDGKWGSGKSTFLRMLRGHLENTQVPSLFFNSWENDYIDDPLAALIAELAKQSKEPPFLSSPSGAVRSAVNAIKTKGKKLLFMTGAIGIKIATAGVMSQEDLAEIVSPEIAKGVTEGVQKFAEKQIEDYEKKSKTVEGFKAALRHLVEVINQGNSGGPPKPIVFFVDELDRCRPDHAIRILERVKHLFDVDGIVFVFAVHQTQLAAAIKSVYGESFDSLEYLKRFFDVSVKLPTPSRNNYCKNLFDFYNSGALTHQIQSGNFLNITLNLVDAFQLDLRAVERVVRTLSLISRGVDRGVEVDETLQPFFAILSEGWLMGYEKFRGGSWSGRDLSRELFSNSPAKDFWQMRKNNLAAYIDAVLFAWDFRDAPEGQAISFAQSQLGTLTNSSGAEVQRHSDIIEYLGKDWLPTKREIRLALTRTEQLRQMS